jgi:hypothetical protein
MRNNFIGDIGDYFKYGLLRKLCGDHLKLGMIWYHYTDEENNGHGKKIPYLDQEENAAYDPELFKELTEIVKIKKDRSIKAVQASRIFPPSTCYYDEPLSFRAFPHHLSRRRHRRDWFINALKAVSSCDVVFLDPDTGLEGTTRRPYEHDEGPKYVSYDEVEKLLEQEKSIIIYQHVRQIKPEQLLEKRVWEIRECLGYQGEVLSVYMKSKSESDGRLFLILPQEKHRVFLTDRLAEFKQTWAHFIP